MCPIYRKFKNYVRKMTNFLCDGEIPERLVKFEEDIDECRLNATDLIDFTDLISGLSKPQMNRWPEYVRNQMRFQMEWQLMYKLHRIRMHPELLDRDLVAEYGEVEIEQVCSCFHYVRTHLLKCLMIHIDSHH